MKVYNYNELLKLRFFIKVFYIGVTDDKGRFTTMSLGIPDISFYVPDLDFIDKYEKEKGVELDTHFKSLVLDRLRGYVEEVLGEYVGDYAFEECVKGDVVIYKTKEESRVVVYRDNEPVVDEEFPTSDIVITISILNRPRSYEYEPLDEIQSKVSERLQLLINKIREEELPLLDNLGLDDI